MNPSPAPSHEPTLQHLLEDVHAAQRTVDKAQRLLEQAIRRAYHCGVGSPEIGEVLGVSPSRVRQIAGARLRLEQP